MEKLDIILKIANDLNKKNKILVPIFNNLKLEKNNVENCIFIAKDDKGLVEQLFIDESLKENESLDARIEKIQEDTEMFLKEKGFNVALQFYKNYSNSIFNYKIYLQDTIINNAIIRQLDAYFLDNNTKDVYKFSLAYGPVKFKNGDDVLSSDICVNILNKLNSLMLEALNGIKYND